jgi:RNA polymerase sigma-B factor
MEAVLDRVGELVSSHLPLVRAIARRYAGSGEAWDDLVQVGSVGLVAAARRFDPSRGTPFAAYAAPTIDGELRRHLRDRASTVRVPRREQRLVADLRAAARDTRRELGREASLIELAASAGVSVGEAQLVIRSAATPASLVGLDLPSVEADEEIEACERRALVVGMLATLDPRERELVRLRYAEDLSQTEIARRMRMSQSQASRLLAHALVKLRSSAGLDRAA